MTSPVCHLSRWVGSVRRLCHLAGGTTLWNQNRLITGIITRPWILKSATRYRDSRLAKSRETSCNPYILVLLMPLFFNSRCMLELKFTIYHRAANMTSQASLVVDVCSIGWRIPNQSSFQKPSPQWMTKPLPVSMHTNHNIMPNSVTLSNNCC